MKEKSNFSALIVVVLLMFAGTLSPSNSVDDGIDKTPYEMIINALVIMTAGLLVFFAWDRMPVKKTSGSRIQKPTQLVQN